MYPRHTTAVPVQDSLLVPYWTPHPGAQWKVANAPWPLLGSIPHTYPTGSTQGRCCGQNIYTTSTRTASVLTCTRSCIMESQRDNCRRRQTKYPRRYAGMYQWSALSKYCHCAQHSSYLSSTIRMAKTYHPYVIHLLHTQWRDTHWLWKRNFCTKKPRRFEQDKKTFEWQMHGK